MTTLEFQPHQLTPEQVFRFLPHGNSNPSSRQRLLATIDSVQTEFKTRRIMARLGLFRCKATDSELIFPEEHYTIDCDTYYLRGATLAAMLVTTVQPELDSFCTDMYKQGRYIEALVVDTIGTAQLNAVICRIRNRLSRHLKGLKVGYTLSPGANKLPIETQNIIFDALRPAETIGVKLTPSLQMAPLKSISALIPFGVGLNCSASTANSCEICEYRHKCYASTCS